jgi:DnaK suppressor protein
MLTTVDIKKIRRSLEMQRAELLKRLGDKVVNKGSDAINPNRSDLAAQYSQKQREILLSARAENQLNDINQALRRIEEGTYGTCEQCKRPINPARLMTIPTVTTCVACRSKRERR